MERTGKVGSVRVRGEVWEGSRRGGGMGVRF